ncbi:MAG: hypothetical protein C3F12_04425 [Candidatus Methylomirabilota bacterium]|nr:nucleotidyltransferase domain-containing protein [Candidatus Methylomirabilis sp.]NJD67791.1 hypothetical protein [candidate division NC10 bacterium]PWB47227.1 MAG: hypothetical protein C3F12_04425 [candidate division NC10 bacterium]
MEFNSPDAFLAHVLWTFRSYLDRMVLVGGFAVRLYELHPRAAPTAFRMLRTFDADLAVSTGPIPLAGQSLASLAEAAGLQPDFRGDHVPPVMKFVSKGTLGGPSGINQYTVEFLTPMTGASIRRGGKAVVTSDIQAGVTAQHLRYLDLLLERPWHVPLVALPGIPEEARTIEVALPHPGFFIVQKILISEELHRHDKRPKDMAYIYQVVSLFRRELPALADDVRVQMSGNPVWRRWMARFRRLTDSLFGGPTAPGVTEAYTVLRAEMTGTGLDVPTPEMIYAGVSLFLRYF